MKEFLGRDFLLETETAKRLFHEYAENLPLIDYHSHIPPREIYEDRRFENLAQVWLGGRGPDGSLFGDHYKWRLMRANGVSEEYITGDRPDYERYLKFVEALELSIGNPMVHWCHLELRRFFGYDGVLNLDTAKDVWELCEEKLQNDPSLTVRGILKKANVRMIGTTDDPTDTLEWHERIAADPEIACKVYPSFRPDNALKPEKPGFGAYLKKLAESAGRESLETAEDVADALIDRLEHFQQHGCRASDHGLDVALFCPCTAEDAAKTLQKALNGERLTQEEIAGYQTYLLLRLGRAYHEKGIVMQIHYNAKRNPNARLYAALGPDTGFDSMNQSPCADALYGLLSALDETDELPRTVLYSLNPADDPVLDTLIGAFQGSEIPGKVQHGSAWWFNDHIDGMERQLRSLASLGVLGNFIGMLTDSRSFLSYPRFEYFRRIFCNLVGGWVENGEYPNDPKALQKIVEGVCFGNAARYFRL